MLWLSYLMVIISLGILFIWHGQNIAILDISQNSDDGFSFNYFQSANFVYFQSEDFNYCVNKEMKSICELEMNMKSWTHSLNFYAVIKSSIEWI